MSWRGVAVVARVAGCGGDGERGWDGEGEALKVWSTLAGLGLVLWGEGFATWDEPRA